MIAVSVYRVKRVGLAVPVSHDQSRADVQQPYPGGSITTAGTTSRLSTRPCDTSTVFWRDGRIGNSSPCDVIGGKQRTISLAWRGDNHRCSLTGGFCRDAAEQWEPDEASVSRPVLRARGGGTPLRDSPCDPVPK